MPHWAGRVSVPDRGNRIPNTEGRKGCSALKQISYSEFCIRYSVFALLIALSAVPAHAETLYNGIVLPSPWPPLQSPNQQYQVPSYITNPPAVIPIDLGRQLLVDDFLIAQTSLTRTPHRPVMYSGNPILSPGAFPDAHNNAMPFSDGVWYDPKDSTYKMWYLGGYGNMVSYATSPDGINWTKPAFSDAVVANSNMVLQVGGTRDSATEWMDLNDIPSRKFKAFASYPVASQDRQELVWVSPDGIHWTAQTQYIINLPWAGDRSTVFYNPFRNVWVNSARDNATLPAVGSFPSHRSRVRDYAESHDLSSWTPAKPSVDTNNFWIGPDINDPPYTVTSSTNPDLYNLDAVAYESVMVGLFSWFYNDQELVELGVGFSRDGYHWVRPTRGAGPSAFIPASNQMGTWNGYNTQSAGGGFLIVGDQLLFYFSGRNYTHDVTSGQAYTGLATLRRDGFYSMDAGATEGQLTSRPVQFSGSHFFVNVQDPGGVLYVEILDAASGQVIAPYSRANCSPISVDKTLQEVTWNGATALSALAGRSVQFRFYLTNGELYSFWVSLDATGRSNGYVAAGGPGFTGPTDTIGAGNIIAPAITAQPQSQSVTAGQTATFTVAATGTLPLNYQWLENGINISSATAASYTTPPTMLTDNGATFQVVVTNSSGTVTCQAATLSVSAIVAPTISTQPVNQAVFAGQSATFSVGAMGTPPLSYQWQENGINISSATATSYTTPPATLADYGATFLVIVTNSTGTVTSQTATLTVQALAPTISTQPTNQTVFAGQSATFSVGALGTPPLSYQWQENGINIASATAASNTTPPTTPADNGATFQVVVTNSSGSVTSQLATLYVSTIVAPTISTQPVNQTVIVGQTATFSVSAIGTLPLTYKWQKNGVTISSATSPSYTTPTTVTTDNGAVFRVIVSNSTGTVTSQGATLTVTAAPVAPSIKTQPANQSVNPGQSATFTVSVAGTLPLLYQWQKNGVTISSATAASYTTLPTTPTDNGAAFLVVVTNSSSSVTSHAATLTVKSVAPSITTQPASQNVTLGQTAKFSVSVAGTPPFIYQWQRNGINISSTNASSYTTPPTTSADNGASYRVVVTNSAGSVTSKSGGLTVLVVKPSITTQPVSQIVAIGQTATFLVAAAGSIPLQYQWQRNGINISAATAFSYTTPPTTATDNNSRFSVFVSNGGGSVTSLFATLTVTASSGRVLNFAQVSTNVNAVMVYPNPWRSDKHTGKNMTFANLPAGSTIKIFTVSGRIVKTLSSSGTSIPWDLTNDSGGNVASGIYLYLIMDGQGNKTHGKLAVIR